MRPTIHIKQRHPASVAGLTLAALLLGFFLVLPLGHQLFHADAEPEACPVHLIETSLLLFALAVFALSYLNKVTTARTILLHTIPLAASFHTPSQSPRAPPLS